MASPYTAFVRWSRHLTLRKKLLYAFITLTVALAVLSGAASSYTVHESLDKRQWGKAVVLTAMTGDNVKAFIAVDQTDSMVKAMDSLSKDPDVSLGMVVGVEKGTGTIKAQKKVSEFDGFTSEDVAKKIGTGDYKFEINGYKVAAYHLTDGGKEIENMMESGKVWFQVVVMNPRGIHDEIKAALTLTIGVSVVMLILGLLTTLFVSGAIVAPITAVNKGMADISTGSGDLTARLRSIGDDELATLASNFNVFVEKIQRIVRDVSTSCTNIASGSLEMSAGMSEMSGTAADIAKGAHSQRTSINDVKKHVDHIAESVMAVQLTVRDTLDVFEKNKKATTKGVAALDDAEVGMSKIEENSKQIAKILQVITEIANQTNLLSLNAAIEAAKAGQQGKGFAVVAEEVRKLAERSAGAGKEIRHLIEVSTQSITDGSEKVKIASEVLKEIQAGTNAASVHMADIQNHTKDQASGSDKVVNSIDGLTGVADQNAAATEQMSATIKEMVRTVDELSRLAETMNGMVSTFRT
jgi:methyl-accepting chemotaxis protein